MEKQNTFAPDNFSLKVKDNGDTATASGTMPNGQTITATGKDAATAIEKLLNLLKFWK